MSGGYRYGYYIIRLAEQEDGVRGVVVIDMGTPSSG